MKRWGVAAATLAAVFGSLVWWRERRPGAEHPGVCTEESLRARVVAAGLTQVGKRELDVYFADAAPQFVGLKPEWCGIFALWAMRQAGLGKGVQWKTGLGFVEPQKFPRVSMPKAGDLAYYDQPYQHQALVAGVRDERVDLINGNGKGGVVSLSSPLLSKATAYYSLQKWIDAAIAEGCA